MFTVNKSFCFHMEVAILCSLVQPYSNTVQPATDSRNLGLRWVVRMRKIPDTEIQFCEAIKAGFLAFCTFNILEYCKNSEIVCKLKYTCISRIFSDYK